MDMGLFKKIVDEAAGIPLITCFCITGLGEPTLDPHLVERVAYIKSVAAKKEVGMYTNGVYVTPLKFDALLAAGLDSMIFSLNAANAAHHEAVMGLKGKFGVVCDNIDYAIEHREAMHIEVRAVSMHDQWTPDEAGLFVRRWAPHAALVREGNWAGGNRTTVPFDTNSCCGRAVTQIYVMYDGRISTCCFDPTGKQTFGDLKVQTLREVYASDPYFRFREAHFNDQAGRYPICKGCSRI